MATLSITVPDTVVARVREAYGAGTNAELKQLILAEIKNKVVLHEATQIALAERSKLETLKQSSADIIAAAESKAITDISLA